MTFVFERLINIQLLLLLLLLTSTGNIGYVAVTVQNFAPFIAETWAECYKAYCEMYFSVPCVLYSHLNVDTCFCRCCT